MTPLREQQQVWHATVAPKIELRARHIIWLYHPQIALKVIPPKTAAIMPSCAGLTPTSVEGGKVPTCCGGAALCRCRALWPHLVVVPPAGGAPQWSRSQEAAHATWIRLIETNSIETIFEFGEALPS